MKTGTFLLFTGMVFSGLGQDLKQDLSAMNARLAQLPDYRITVDYSAGDTSDLFEAGTASVLSTPEGYFYSTEFASMIINQQHTLIVNEEERTLIWSENQKAAKGGPAAADVILQGVDTLIASADSVYFSFTGNQRTYHLRFHDSYFDLVELTFDGLYLNHVLYFYNPQVSGEAGMTASCSIAIDEHPAYDPKLLQTDFYLARTNGEQAVPTEAFTGYILIYNPSVESSIE